jgi:hypothetical protein
LCLSQLCITVTTHLTQATYTAKRSLFLLKILDLQQDTASLLLWVSGKDD